ncbi:Mu transposase C-terminal domain-containing protein [Mycolicibacterium fortuitum]|uniref:Mu transposase C-terminal domain-containing protein n=1 Tax=Mycolicibacterium fortuitum TaxID=1766 RepID=UPI001AEFE6DD|nr:Mu transposase C-terminal domain-containing protein [Mycolicibacterium fortuitum]MBP3083812.1 Mu transposase C-terminal domain-containing protein [Mycolicibacterium fortuitum]
MWSFIVTVYQNRPHKGLVLREHPGRTFTPNQMYSATFDASAGIPIPISQSDYISLMPRHDRTFQSDGIHLSNEIYDSPDLNEVRGRLGKHEIRQDPYDTERIWARHPDNGEWITCFARSIRLAALPFGTSTTASLSATDQADDPHTQWAQDFLDAESDRVKATRSRTDKGTQKALSGKAAQKKATKTAAERANRKRDPLPRPAVVEPIPTAVPVREHPDDYTVA